jgi:adenosylcobinamide-GDP ribazoletransferase
LIGNFWTAMSFLTVLPTPHGIAIPPVEKIGGTLMLYPLIGLLLGAVLCLASIPLFHYLAPLSAAVFLTILWAMFTGGLHLDGVSDACDALFSSRSRERALEIMKDPHIGVMGAIGLFGILAGKTALLAQLGMRFDAILAAVLLGRWAMVFGATTSRYARAEGGIASGIIHPNAPRLAVATLWLPIAAAFSAPLPLVAAWFTVTVATLAARLLFNRKLGGLTGDCLGAIGETSELLVLAVYSSFA